MGGANIIAFGKEAKLAVIYLKDGDACLSCFGLMKEFKDDQRTTGSVDPESVIFRFGTILLELLTGRQIPPSHASEMIHGKRVTELIDPNLKGNFSAEEATVVYKLASQCLQYEDIESLHTKYLVTTLETKTFGTIPSYDILEMTKRKEVSSPLEEACSRMDLAAIHKILVMAGYEDDKEVIELSFEEWIQEVKDLEEVRKRGDQAFVGQDFKTAIAVILSSLNIEEWCIRVFMRGVVYVTYSAINQRDPSAMGCMHKKCSLIGQPPFTCNLWHYPN